MTKPLIILAVFFVGINLNAQTNDSLAAKNKKQIEELRNRIASIENSGKSNEALLLENKQLTLKVKQQQDSINILNGIIRKLSDNSSTQKSDKCVRLYYKASQTQLNYADYKELDQIVKEFLDNPKMKLKIAGHADKSIQGTETFNIQLSNERAISLKNYLITIKKVPAEKIEIEWHGSSISLPAATSPDKNYLNRRVEVSIF